MIDSMRTCVSRTEWRETKRRPPKTFTAIFALRFVLFRDKDVVSKSKLHAAKEIHSCIISVSLPPASLHRRGCSPCPVQQEQERRQERILEADVDRSGMERHLLKVRRYSAVVPGLGENLQKPVQRAPEQGPSDESCPTTKPAKTEHHTCFLGDTENQIC